MEHISDDDLERYCLGMIPEGPELDLIEEHLLWCDECIGHACETQEYIDAIRAAIIRGNFDLDLTPKRPDASPAASPNIASSAPKPPGARRQT